MEVSSNPFRILSIDGGGLRGVFAVEVLKCIEEITERSIFDSFDLFAGTSTGGLIAAALTLQDGNRGPRYNVSDIEKIYLEHGKKIFPAHSSVRRYIRQYNVLRPKFSSKGLDSVLTTYFGNKRISDCQKPILITAFDLERYRPIYFTSRSIYASDVNTKINAELVSICRATSAAPVYLPSYPFIYADTQDEPYQTNCIDGGVYSNNPALAAYIEIKTHLNEPLYAQGATIEEPDIHIVSIGTGLTMKSIDKELTKKWGLLHWGMPIIDVMMQGSSQAIDSQLRSLLNLRYIRINTDIEERYSRLDDCNESTFNYLRQRVRQEIFNNSVFRQRFDNFRRYAQI